jgi:hypothetical protein
VIGRPIAHLYGSLLSMMAIAHVRSAVRNASSLLLDVTDDSVSY